MGLRRRGLLAASALTAIVISACTSADLATLQRIATDAQAIATGFGTAISTMTSVITATVKTTLQGYLSDITNAAGAIASAASTAATQTSVGQIMTAVSGFASLIPGIGLSTTIAATVNQIVAAAQVLIPIIAAAAGLAGAAARTAAPAMTEGQAIAVLTRGP